MKQKKEIEIKLKLSKKQLEVFVNWLKKEAEFKEDFLITDFYLDNPKSSFFFKSKKGYKDILEFIRVRLSDKNVILCHKIRVLDDDGNTKYCRENEKELRNIDLVLTDLEQKGFSEKIVLKKNRKIYFWKNFEIAVDNVKGLGKFVEFELRGKGDKNEFEKVFKLLKSIGIKKFQTFNRGYICMKVNPDYNFSDEIILE